MIGQDWGDIGGHHKDLWTKVPHVLELRHKMNRQFLS